MHILAVLDHPYGAAAHDDRPRHRSYSAALLRAAVEGATAGGATVDVIDLVGDGFDPVLRADDLVAWRHDRAHDPMALDYQRRLADADHLVLVFPTWWMATPSSLKGFIDKVVTPGFAYHQTSAGGLLHRRLTRLRGVTVLTPMTTRYGLYRLWFARPGQRMQFRGTLGLIGIRGLRWFSFQAPAARSAAWRAARLARVRRYFERLTTS